MNVILYQCNNPNEIADVEITIDVDPHRLAQNMNDEIIAELIQAMIDKGHAQSIIETLSHHGDTLPIDDLALTDDEVDDLANNRLQANDLVTMLGGKALGNSDKEMIKVLVSKWGYCLDREAIHIKDLSDWLLKHCTPAARKMLANNITSDQSMELVELPDNNYREDTENFQQRVATIINDNMKPKDRNRLAQMIMVGEGEQPMEWIDQDKPLRIFIAMQEKLPKETFKELASLFIKELILKLF